MPSSRESTAFRETEHSMDNAIALVDANGKMSYREMLATADEIAQGTEERALAFVVVSNTPATVCGYLGFLRRRVAVAMIPRDTPLPRFEQLVQTYRPQLLWVPEGYLDGTRPMGQVVRRSLGYTLLDLGNPRHDLDPQLALLLTTSGSTGSPKFVRLSYGNLESNARSIAEYQQITPRDRAITTLPLSYSYGISILNSHLVSGASLALCEDSIISGGFWDLLDRTGATNFGGVPYTYQMLKRLRFERRPTPSLRFISQAGGRLGETLQGEFAQICAQKGIDFFVMYGQTEATARISWLPPEYAGSKLGSIGIPIPGGSFSLVDVETGEEVHEPDRDGELVYHGPNVSMGYATCPEDLAKPDELHGVLHTGDIARFDGDGFYYITGRLKRFLKMFGSRISLDEVEKLLEKQGWQVAATGVDNRLLVFVTGGHAQEVLPFLLDNTSLHASGIEVVEIDELPHTASGKVDYPRLMDSAS